ncbi:hypothetical protein A2U01_0060586, partial [Trifolium medium]|nr:hypothetical protein [Trifolium medium]
MVVCVPTTIRCSNGSVFPSKVGRWGVLKPSGTRVSHRTCDRGWDSTISSSSSCSVALFSFFSLCGCHLSLEAAYLGNSRLQSPCEDILCFALDQN